MAETMLTSDGLLSERAHPTGLGGVQRIYRWGKYGASAVNSSMLHGYAFSWEVAVLVFDDDGDWELTYDTPLTGDVAVFHDTDDTNAFLAKIAALPQD